MASASSGMMLVRSPALSTVRLRVGPSPLSGTSVLDAVDLMDQFGRGVAAILRRHAGMGGAAFDLDMDHLTSPCATP